MAQYQTPLDGIFQALADPTRRAVIGRLGRGPASVGELAAPFDMALPSFMKHIHMLEETAGKPGREVIYIPTEAAMPILEASRLRPAE